MSSSVVSLIVAVVGVLGTLGSSIWTQRLGQRAKAAEAAREVERAAVQYRRERETRRYDELRSTYSSLNAGAREYRDAMAALCYALRDDRETGEIHGELARTRRDFRTLRAEAQMIVSDTVMRTSSVANGELSDAYGILMRIDRGQRLRPGDSLDGALKALEQARRAINAMREEMRADLGVGAAPRD